MSIEKKYQLLDEIQHCLQRPGVYIGSTKPHDSEEYLLDSDGILRKRQIQHIPGLMKIYDEIITNSVDESRRNKKLNKIEITVDQSKNMITVYDNGGIPVVEHAKHKIYVPELIFSHLRAGSNFNDDEARIVAGTHGMGSTLTNIFSTRFEVETSDGKKSFKQVFESNMRKRSTPKIGTYSKGFTEIKFQPDLSQFGLKEIDSIHLELMRKRAIDLAACNPGLQITFNGTKYKFDNFKKYIQLYGVEPFHESDKTWEIGFASSSDGHQAISFVNSAETKDGGSHVNYIVNQVTEGIRELIRKKHKVEVKPGEIKNHMMVFVSCSINNPSFGTQTKDKLITEPKNFGSEFEVSKKIIKEIFASEIVESILDWIERKEDADERAQLRKLNSSLGNIKVERLIDAKEKGNRDKCSLGIFEGLSALSAVRKFRDPQKFGAFPLKGKFINVSEMKPAEIIQNDEAVDLIASLGLKLGEEATDLRYGKILIYTDADPDGSAIFCLLLNFFAKFWPELFDQGRIYRAMTPLMVAKNGKETKYFYTQEQINQWKPSNKWEIGYKKGLGSLEDFEYSVIINDPILVRITKDDVYKHSLTDWFGIDSAPRKIRLMS